MPEQPVREANGLLALAIKRIELTQGKVHKGVSGHIIAAQVQLNAVAALLAMDAAPPPTEPSPSEDL